jgi:hypothetical protein
MCDVSYSNKMDVNRSTIEGYGLESSCINNDK